MGANFDGVALSLFFLGMPTDPCNTDYNPEIQRGIRKESPAFLIEISTYMDSAALRTIKSLCSPLEARVAGINTIYRTFGNYPLEIAGLFNRITGRGKRKIQILRNFEGLVKSGEMLVVLGRPGSGCSTLLKTIAGETHGFYIGEGSRINYQGKRLSR